MVSFSMQAESSKREKNEENGKGKTSTWLELFNNFKMLCIIYLSVYVQARQLTVSLLSPTETTSLISYTLFPAFWLWAGR